MIKFHYIWRGYDLNPEELRHVSKELEEVGYESVLLTFNSEHPDYFIKSAVALIPGNKLKYMIALRPYHVSPQFCAMMTEGYNQIDQNRLIFNWVAGDFDQRSDEGKQFDVFGETESTDTIVKRTTFLRRFVELYNSFSFVSVKPEMIFSGFSNYTLETTKIFNGTSLCMIDDYRKNIKEFVDINKRMVCLSVVLVEKEEDIEKFYELSDTVNPRFRNISIVDTEDNIHKRLNLLASEGITDVLVDTRLPVGNKFLPKTHNDNYKKINKIIMQINSENKTK
jgi:hypothetical protein